MSGPFFDVFVVGAADPSPAGVQKLAGALSSPLGMPAAAVAKALAERKLCAGKGLVQQDAQALVRELKPLGALTVIRPAAEAPVASSNGRPAPPPPVRPPPPPPVRGPGPGTLAMGAPQSTTVDDPFAPPPSGPRGLTLDGPDSGPGKNPFAAPPSSPDLGLAPSSGPKDAPPGGPDPFAGGPEAEERSLELAFSPPSRAAPPPSPAVAEFSADRSKSVAGTSLPGASALNIHRMAATSSSSGLSVDKEVAAEAYRVRCHKHGLLYDSRKASGCGKCMDRGRKLSAAIDARNAGIKIADFDSAAKRAFVGLALALVIGFIPAAYHAFRVGARDIHRLRDEQEILSRKPATEEIVQRFQELNTTVDNAASRATRTTGIVWFVVTGLALFGWYRVT
ncbi:MAG TPA: hypothetical protein VN914_20875, partial [Polyangia bacterium]|nr:hypothetical protein [Polyangia bacterium]